MCGIAGIIGHEIRPRTIQRMTNVMAHRGPDAEGFFQEGIVQLGHRRLSILDTSARGNQPMHDPTNRYVLIHNGEIYNFREVRNSLGFAHGTETDTEVILAAWIKWGPECLHRFAGMFAFAIWDRVEQSLFIARDRLGIKPIYYRLDGSRLIFASEIRSVMMSDCFKPEVDLVGLGSYLTYQTVYGEGTILEGVKMIPPGHYGTWKQGKWELKSWWNVWENALPDAASMDRKAVLARIRSLMDQSIARRMVSDVPVGAFLSGGIDSSAVVALMAQRSEQPIDTFSVGFENKDFEESEWSSLIAKKYATRHHPITLKRMDFLRALPDALAKMDHPSGDGINSFVVAQVTRAQGIKVALSGLGGDELFAGYPVFTQLPNMMGRPVMMIPYPLRVLMAEMYGLFDHSRNGAKKKAALAARSRSLDELYKVFRTVYSWNQSKRLIGLTRSVPHPLESLLRPHANLRKRLPLLSQIGGLEIGSYAQSVLLRDTDQMSMAHALEVRVPFFDHDLVSFVMGIPDAYKHPTYPKQLLVESLGDLLPEALVHRKKMGFMFPWDEWMRGDLRNLATTRLQEFAQRGFLVDPGALMRTWKEFLAGKGPWLWTHLWLVVVLEDWLQRNNIFP